MTKQKNLNLRFHYAIRFSNGKYYTGKAGADYMGEGEFSAITYTYDGAYNKIKRMGWNAFVTILESPENSCICHLIKV